MKYSVETIEGTVFHIYRHEQPDQQLLLEAKTKGTPLTGTYSFNKHQPHNSTGEYHLHVYDGNNQIFAINQSGTGHDGYQGTRIPNKVFNALKAKFPNWTFPDNQIIESVEFTYVSDFRKQFLRPVRVFKHQSQQLDLIESFDGFFHCFANDTYQTGGGGNFQKTVALIETMDGNIIKIAMDRFRFTDIEETL